MAKAKLDKKTRLQNWAEATDRMVLYREAACALQTRRATQDEAVRKVEASYQLDIDGLAAELTDLCAELRQFAEDHKRDFVSLAEGGEGRTRFSHGIEIGWRTSPPRVHITKRLFEKALRWLEEFGGDTYVRRDPELARDAVKAELMRAEQARDQDIIDRFAGQGITLKQDEEFVLEVVSGQ